MDMRKLVEENGYIFIDSYVLNNEKRIILQDNFGYKYDTLFCHFQRGHRGFLIVGAHNPFSIDNMRIWLRKNKENILIYDASNYINNLSKIIFLCTRCNRKFNDSWACVKSKIACPECMKGIIGEKNKTHGHSGSKLYKSWGRMIARCSNKNDPHHLKYYINKGIMVCDEWKEYKNFYNWAIINGYEDGLAICSTNPRCIMRYFYKN